MKILNISEKNKIPISRIIFYCDEQNYPIENEDNRFQKAYIYDMYNDDCTFITIDYFINDDDECPSFSKLIRKGEITHIDIIWEALN